MNRIKLTVAYDGTAYCGWQLQPNGLTIEEELNKAIEHVTGEKIRVIGASRTDAGVHAKCNIAVFDTESAIPAEKFSYAINRYLPSDIRIFESVAVEADFHPRHCKTKKTYEYWIDHEKFQDPLLRLYSHFVYGKLNLNAMRNAAAKLEGEHDFKSFCATEIAVKTTIRTIYKIEIEERGTQLIIRVQGNGFLYNMVRIIVGTLLEVGMGRRSEEEMTFILETLDRRLAGPTAPARGLHLVAYEFED